MASPLTRDPASGTVSWDSQPDDSYLVTGVDTDGRRFRIETGSWLHASGLNLYRGTRWLVRDGRRYRINAVFN